jgi:hypothetical protein
MAYRSLVVRMYYAIEPGKDTPNPYAEFRAYIISNKRIPSAAMPVIEFELEYLEWCFKTMPDAILPRKGVESNVYYVIKGREDNQWIDEDEASKDLKRSGLSAGEIKFGDILRYVRFVKPNTDDEIRYRTRYNEKRIREEVITYRDKNPWWRVREKGFKSYLEAKKDVGLISAKDYTIYLKLLSRIPVNHR